MDNRGSFADRARRFSEHVREFEANGMITTPGMSPASGSADLSVSADPSSASIAPPQQTRRRGRPSRSTGIEEKDKGLQVTMAALPDASNQGQVMSSFALNPEKMLARAEERLKILPTLAPKDDTSDAGQSGYSIGRPSSTPGPAYTHQGPHGLNQLSQPFQHNPNAAPPESSSKAQGMVIGTKKDDPNFWFWTWDNRKLLKPQLYAKLWERRDVLPRFSIDVQTGFWNLAAREHVLPPKEFCQTAFGCTQAEFIHACFFEKAVPAIEPDGPWKIPVGENVIGPTDAQLAQPPIDFQKFTYFEINPVEAKFFEAKPMVLWGPGADMPIYYLAYGKHRKDFPTGKHQGPFTRAIEHVLDHPEWQRVHLSDLNWFIAYKGAVIKDIAWKDSCDEVDPNKHIRFFRYLAWFCARSKQIYDWTIPDQTLPFPNQRTDPPPHVAMLTRPQPADVLAKPGVPSMQ